MRMSKAPTVAAAKNLEVLAFASTRELAELVRRKRVSSLALTGMYLQRLKGRLPEAASMKVPAISDPSPAIAFCSR
jgi:hypothetical protein